MEAIVCVLASLAQSVAALAKQVAEIIPLKLAPSFDRCATYLVSEPPPKPS